MDKILIPEIHCSNVCCITCISDSEFGKSSKFALSKTLPQSAPLPFLSDIVCDIMHTQVFSIQCTCMGSLIPFLSSPLMVSVIDAWYLTIQFNFFPIHYFVHNVYLHCAQHLLCQQHRPVLC